MLGEEESQFLLGTGKGVSGETVPGQSFGLLFKAAASLSIQKENGARNVNTRLFGKQRDSLTRWQRARMGSTSSGNGERDLGAAHPAK